MEEAEARKARLAAMRARAGGGTVAAGGRGGLLTPQMLGAPPVPSAGGADRPPEAPPKPMAPMPTTGFYSSLHTPVAETPILEAFSRGDVPQSFVGGRDRPPIQHPMGGMVNAGGGGWHGRPPPPGPPRGRGGYPGPPGMQMGGFHRGQGLPPHASTACLPAHMHCSSVWAYSVNE